MGLVSARKGLGTGIVEKDWDLFRGITLILWSFVGFSREFTFIQWRFVGFSREFTFIQWAFFAFSRRLTRILWLPFRFALLASHQHLRGRLSIVLAWGIL